MNQPVIGHIIIEHLKVPCVIGVESEERLKEQHIFVDLKVEINMAKCIASDHIHDTIDYVKLAKLCVDIAQLGEFRLLESYAHALTEAILTLYKPYKVSIKIKKPQALENALNAIVELEKKY